MGYLSPQQLVPALDLVHRYGASDVRPPELLAVMHASRSESTVARRLPWQISLTHLLGVIPAPKQIHGGESINMHRYDGGDALNNRVASCNKGLFYLHAPLPINIGLWDNITLLTLFDSWGARGHAY